MSEVQAEPGEERSPKTGAAFFIPTPHIDQHWPAIDRILQQAEKWSNTVSAADIHAQLVDGRMQVWGVLDQNRHLGVAITRLSQGTRGMLCTVWLFLPLSGGDEASFCALFDEVEGFARSKKTTALEIYAAPWLGPTLQANWLGAKVTAVVLECDLRAPRRTN